MWCVVVLFELFEIDVFGDEFGDLFGVFVVVYWDFFVYLV